MVKEQNKNNSKRQEMQGKADCPGRASKIGYLRRMTIAVSVSAHLEGYWGW